MRGMQHEESVEQVHPEPDLIEADLPRAFMLQEALWCSRSTENHPGNFKYKDND